MNFTHPPRSAGAPLAHHLSGTLLRAIFTCWALLLGCLNVHAQAPGSLDTAFVPNVSGSPLAVGFAVPALGGKTYIGGKFTTVSGQARPYMARLDAAGALDPSFNVTLNDQVICAAIQDDGKILIGGAFTSVNGVGRNFIARLNSDGTTDTSFTGSTGWWVYGMTIQSDGKLIINGEFSTVNGVARLGVARLNADGTNDPAWLSSGTDGMVVTTCLQADNKIVIGGYFGNVNGTARTRLARLNANGTLDTAFNASANDVVGCITQQPDGKLLIGGSFTSVNGSAVNTTSGVNRLARLNADGTRDTAFNSSGGVGLGGVNNGVDGISLQTNGSVVLAGQFNAVNGATGPTGMGRVDANGVRDTLFAAGLSGAGGQVNGLSIQGDGKLFYTGWFGTMHGTARTGIARLHNDAAPQSIVVSAPGTVQWQRSGAAAEVVRVRVFRSTDGGANWSFVGNASRIGTTANWQLSGLTLSGGDMISLHARVLANRFNGSSGLIEQTVTLANPYAFVSLQGTPTSSSATLRASIWEPGIPKYSFMGVVWSAATIPDASAPGTGNTRVQYYAGSAPGSPNAQGEWAQTSVTGLPSNSLIYARAFTETVLSAGYTYGPEITFTTLPAVTTAVQTNVAAGSATLGGNVPAGGGAAVTDRGIVWSTASIPTTSAPATGGAITKTGMGTGTGTFSATVNGLPAFTTIFYRAYAVNGGGYTYGPEISFATLSIAPVLSMTNAPPRNIAATTAELGFYLFSRGAPLHSENGVVWSTSPIPVGSAPGTGNTKVVTSLLNNTIGGYHTLVTGLQPNTVYYARQYALQPTSPASHHYSAEATFTTLAALPAVTTAAQTTVTSTSAVLGGNVTADGGAAVTDRGIVWATTATPTTANNKVANGTGLGTFSATVGSLPPGTLIYVRAYAINSIGTSYGAQISFTTLAVLPTVVTATPATITASSAVLGGNVTADGGAPVTERGIVWATTPAPTTANNKVANGSGLGSYSAVVSGLPPATLIYVCAYATNSVGTAYGNHLTFTTAAAVPGVITIAPGNVTSTSGVFFGSVQSTGGAAVTERGFVYSGVPFPDTAAPGSVFGTVKVISGAGAGAFSHPRTGLTPGLTVFYRAYAINSVGYSYGALIPLTPQVVAGPPVLNPCGVRVTCFSGIGTNGEPDSTGHVAGQFDTTSLPYTGSQNNNPLGSQIIYSHADWTRARMGEVFGITLDGQVAPSAFVSATSIYNSSYTGFNQWPSNGTAGDTFGPTGNPGMIYRVDGTTGAVCEYAQVPGAGTAAKANTPGSLGNLDFHRHNNGAMWIYVSNLDDGRIYRVAWQATCPPAGAPLTASVFFDHGSAGRPVAGLSAILNTGGSGVTAPGRRVWAVQAWQDRLYYSVWNEGTTSKASGPASEIWSVGFDPLGNLAAGSARFEFDTGSTLPVSDIAFSETGSMMIAERGCYVVPAGSNPGYGILPGMINTSLPHRARILQYRRDSSPAHNWVPSSKTFTVGNFSESAGPGKNSAGGIDIDCNETVHATGDALALGTSWSHAWYGLQVIPSAANPAGNGTSFIQNSHLVDYDGISSVSAKNSIGDVALYHHKCPCYTVVDEQVSCQGSTVRWTVTLTNTSGTDISFLSFEQVTPGVTPLAASPLVLTPPFLAGETRTMVFDFALPVNIPAEICFTIKSANQANTSCCFQRFCLRPECCMRLENERYEWTAPGNYNYCFTVTNLSGVTATRLVVAGTPAGTLCPNFTSPVIPLSPPMVQGETRSFCTPFTAPGWCRRLNFVVSLQDAQYRTCCSQRRSRAWWIFDPVEIAPNAPVGRVRAIADLSTMIMEDYSSIDRVVFYMDDQIVATKLTPPWLDFTEWSASPGVHQVRYTVISKYGHEIRGPSREVTIGGGMLQQPAIPLALEASTRPGDSALILEWSDPAVILETSEDLQRWTEVRGASSPHVVEDLSAPSRFFRLIRP